MNAKIVNLKKVTTSNLKINNIYIIFAAQYLQHFYLSQLSIHL